MRNLKTQIPDQVRDDIKTGLSVKYTPIKGRGFFDIFGKEQPDGPKIRKTGDFTRFFVMAFIIFFIFLAIGAVINAKDWINNTRDTAFAGYDSLMDGAEALAGKDMDGAEMSFKKAETAFKGISQNIQYMAGQMESGMYIKTAEDLADSALTVSEIGSALTGLISEARNIPEAFVRNNSGTGSDTSLISLVHRQKEKLDEIYTKAVKLQNELAEVDEGLLPSDLQDKISVARQYAGIFLAVLNEIKANFNTALILMGDKVPHRYLVLFQNNHELRATGGFIGSYALVDVNDGVLRKLEIKDVYESDGQLTENIPAPPGINRLADRLYMRDANYSPDFPSSARRIMWLLEHSAGPSADTVIAIDQTVAEKLLELIGLVEVEGYPFAIGADDFNDIFSFHIESKQSKTKTPKQLLIDFIPILKTQLLTSENIMPAIKALGSLISAGHIQVYSVYPEINAVAERFGLDGGIISPAGDTDYLNIVTTSIGGNKSDAYINADISHRTEIGKSGKIIDHLCITKEHTWQEEDFKNWKSLINQYGTGKEDEKTLRFIHGEGDNIDYMRVFVPKGSRILNADGIKTEEIASGEDLGYTVFSFVYGPLKNGQSEAIKISYELPYTLSFSPDDIYRFIMQKQAGAENMIFKKELSLSDGLEAVEIYPENGLAVELQGNEIFLAKITK